MLPVIKSDEDNFPHSVDTLSKPVSVLIGERPVRWSGFNSLSIAILGYRCTEQIVYNSPEKKTAPSRTQLDRSNRPPRDPELRCDIALLRTANLLEIET